MAIDAYLLNLSLSWTLIWGLSLLLSLALWLSVFWGATKKRVGETEKGEEQFKWLHVLLLLVVFVLISWPPWGVLEHNTPILRNVSNEILHDPPAQIAIQIDPVRFSEFGEPVHGNVHGNVRAFMPTFWTVWTHFLIRHCGAGKTWYIWGMFYFLCLSICIIDRCKLTAALVVLSLSITVIPGVLIGKLPLPYLAVTILVCAVYSVHRGAYSLPPLMKSLFIAMLLRETLFLSPFIFGLGICLLVHYLLRGMWGNSSERGETRSGLLQISVCLAFLLAERMLLLLYAGASMGGSAFTLLEPFYTTNVAIPFLLATLVILFLSGQLTELWITEHKQSTLALLHRRFSRWGGFMLFGLSTAVLAFQYSEFVDGVGFAGRGMPLQLLLSQLFLFCVFAVGYAYYTSVLRSTAAGLLFMYSLAAIVAMSIVEAGNITHTMGIFVATLWPFILFQLSHYLQHLWRRHSLSVSLFSMFALFISTYAATTAWDFSPPGLFQEQERTRFASQVGRYLVDKRRRTFSSLVKELAVSLDTYNTLQLSSGKRREEVLIDPEDADLYRLTGLHISRIAILNLFWLRTSKGHPSWKKHRHEAYRLIPVTSLYDGAHRFILDFGTNDRGLQKDFYKRERVNIDVVYRWSSSQSEVKLPTPWPGRYHIRVVPALLVYPKIKKMQLTIYSSADEILAILDRTSLDFELPEATLTYPFTHLKLSSPTFRPGRHGGTVDFRRLGVPLDKLIVAWQPKGD